MQTNPAVDQNINVKWSESPWNQSGKAQHIQRWKTAAYSVKEEHVTGSETDVS